MEPAELVLIKKFPVELSFDHVSDVIGIQSPVIKRILESKPNRVTAPFFVMLETFVALKPSTKIIANQAEVIDSKVSNFAQDFSEWLSNQSWVHLFRF